MNDKILSAAKRARLIRWKVDHAGERVIDKDSYARAQKLVEIIVSECAKIADNGYGADHFGNGISGYQLLEHFGISEKGKK